MLAISMNSGVWVRMNAVPISVDQVCTSRLIALMS